MNSELRTVIPLMRSKSAFDNVAKNYCAFKQVIFPSQVCLRTIRFGDWGVGWLGGSAMEALCLQSRAASGQAAPLF